MRINTKFVWTAGRIAGRADIPSAASVLSLRS